jgi:uroporphyrinogen-III synthase
MPEQFSPDSRHFMAILVTRPQPDNDMTAAALRARGFTVLQAPMLRFEPVALSIDADAHFGAVVVTSANAIRAISAQPAAADLHRLPLFAVGDRTADAARSAGFKNVISADGDAGALRDLIGGQGNAQSLNGTQALLYLAGADLARDLAGELGERGFNVVTLTAYRMVPEPDLPPAVGTALANHDIAAVLHYSRRSARAFFAGARAGGVEFSALAIPQYCLSESVAAVALDAGATRVPVAPSPNEKALFALLDRAIRA